MRPPCLLVNLRGGDVTLPPAAGVFYTSNTQTQNACHPPPGHDSRDQITEIITQLSEYQRAGRFGNVCRFPG